MFLSDQKILQTYHDLPSKLQEEVWDFMQFVLYKYQYKPGNTEKIYLAKRKLGLWKDKITFIAPDFNEPIDDLKEYM